MSALMTAARTADDVSAAPSGGKVTQWHVLHSEWTKFRSLRSTVTTLLVAIGLMIGLSALISAVTASQFDSFNRADKATFDAVATSLSGVSFAQLAIGVLGVLLITGEYSTGMIRSSLTAVPRRLPVLWGKLGVFGAVVFVLSLVASVVSFFVGQALLSGTGSNVALTDDGALGSILGAACYLTVAGLIALAIGGLLRNTAAGISVFVATFFVIPPLTQLLPASWTSHFVQYLPSNAGAALYGGSQGVDNPLSASSGAAVLCGYAVVLIALAAWRLRSVDA